MYNTCSTADEEFPYSTLPFHGRNKYHKTGIASAPVWPQSLLLWLPAAEQLKIRERVNLHEEHVTGVVCAPVNSERLFLHQPTAERLQVNVVPVL